MNETPQMLPSSNVKIKHDRRVLQTELKMQNEELQRAQIALEESRDRYVDLYEFAPIGYLTLTREGMIREINLTAATMLGMERNKMINRRFDSFIVESDKDHWHSHYLSALKCEGQKVCEIQIQRGDLTHFYAQLGCQDTKFGDETMMRIAFADISERIETEAKLQKSDTSLRLMLESVTDCAIVMLDAKGFVENWNSGAQRIHGYLAEDIIGKHISIIYRTEDIACGKPQMELDTVLAMGRYEVDGLRVRKDGSQFWANVVLTTMRDNQGKLCGFAKLTRDVTERRRLEQLLNENNIELERTRALAEKANQAKSDFISSMSHELRTPLNAILGFAQLLEASLLPPTSIQALRIQQILKAGWYLLELINEILDLAVIESGKLTLSPEPISLAKIMLECQTMIESQAQKRDIKLTFPKFETPCFVQADRIRLKQVLINLVTNAIKYNREHGSVEIQYSTEQVGKVRVSVIDNGVGLSPEKLVQLFEPFNRLGQENGAEEGTGIGLVVTRRLVDLMDGTIGVESVEGKGSKFWIELNLSEQPKHNLEIITPHKFTQPVQGAQKQRLLLYVEDNPANLMVVEQIIENQPGLNMISAHDGNHGVALARAHRPDVILMDINLPGISGVEAMSILRKEQSTMHIPIIALSANAMLQDIEKALAAGFSSYLTKPIKSDELMSALKNALD